MAAVMTSQNGWTVHTNQRNLVLLSRVTGRVRGGDVHTVFHYLVTRFHAEVEPVVTGHSWGWAYRPIRGKVNGFSNHASGTAIDLNAPKHPLGRRGTFTAVQVSAIRRILADIGGGAILWGGDYKNRADEMHFEVNTDAAGMRAAARRVTTATPVKPPTPAPAPATPTGGKLTMSEAKAINERLDALAATVHQSAERMSVNTQTLADLQKRRSQETVSAVEKLLRDAGLLKG